MLLVPQADDEEEIEVEYVSAPVDLEALVQRGEQPSTAGERGAGEDGGEDEEEERGGLGLGLGFGGGLGFTAAAAVGNAFFGGLGPGPVGREKGTQCAWHGEGGESMRPTGRRHQTCLRRP